MCRLKVHPEFGGVAEVGSQQERGLGSHATLAADQFVDAVLRNTKAARELRLGSPAWLEKLSQKNSARVSGNSTRWQHRSSFSDSRYIARRYNGRRQNETRSGIDHLRECCNSRATCRAASPAGLLAGLAVIYGIAGAKHVELVPDPVRELFRNLSCGFRVLAVIHIMRGLICERVNHSY
jgi:hypothetical protein